MAMSDSLDLNDRLALKGRVAFITGAGRGIGAATARYLAAAGARIAVTDANLGAAQTVTFALREMGADAVAIGYDVTDKTGPGRAVEETHRALGPINILINNAGIARYSAFVDLNEDEWARVVDINLGGTYRTARAVIPDMIARRDGRIINISSITGRQGFAGFAHYCSSKFAVIGLTQSLAAEFAPLGITVNAVCPGSVDTPMRDILAQELVGAAPGISKMEQAIEAWNGLVPLGRPQTSEDIAEVIVFLSSGMARNITGSTYHVDGGAVPR